MKRYNLFFRCIISFSILFIYSMSFYSCKEPTNLVLDEEMERMKALNNKMQGEWIIISSDTVVNFYNSVTFIKKTFEGGNLIADESKLNYNITTDCEGVMVSTSEGIAKDIWHYL